MKGDPLSSYPGGREERESSLHRREGEREDTNCKIRYVSPENWEWEGRKEAAAGEKKRKKGLVRLRDCYH